MKKTELKKVLKPIIKDCIKEVIFEDGVLSGIISEVVQGLGKETIVEQKVAARTPQSTAAADSLVRQQMSATKKKMLEAIGQDAYGGVDLFEGSSPMSTSGNEGVGSQASPMAGRDPGDAGVDISGIMNVGNAANWGALAKGRRE